MLLAHPGGKEIWMRNVVGWSLIGMALAWSAAAIEAPTEWTPRGIGGGGGMFGPSINPGNPDEMYVGCDMSPRFHTRDGGKTWRTIPFRQLNSNHQVPVSFTRDPNIQWVIGPARSTDGGRTWTPWDERAWPKSRSASMLYGDYNNPGRVLVAAGNDLWITQDGAKTFQKVFSERDAIHLAGAFFDSDVIYACTCDSGLVVSRDGGKTFAKGEATGLPAGERVSSFAGGRSGDKVRLYCVTIGEGSGRDIGSGGGLHKSFRGVYVLDPGQKAWVRKMNGLPAGAHPYFIKKAINDADVVYVAGGSEAGHPIVYKSIDGGGSWKDVFLTAGNKNIQVAWSGDKCDRGWGFGEYAEGFGVCALDSQQLIVTDMGFAHLSQNGGESWTACYSYPTVPRKPGDPVAPGASYSTSGMDVINVWHLVWADPQNIFACVTDIKALRSEDGGKNWSFNYAGDMLNTVYYGYQDPRTKAVYVITSSIHDIYHTRYLTDGKLEKKARGLLLCSTDKFATWETIKDFGNVAVHSMAVDPRDPNRLYVGVVHHVQGGIYMTAGLDKGEQATWERLAAPPRTEGHPLSIVPLNDGSLLCSYSGRRTGLTFTPSSGVFWSPDNGRTWEDRTDPAMRLWTKEVSVDPGDPSQNTWYACVCCDGGGTTPGSTGLWRTKDRGKTWKQIADASLSRQGALNVQACTFVPDHPACLFFSTYLDGIYFTKNLNAEKPVFRQLESFPFAKARHMIFNPFDKDELWVCTSGNGIYAGRMGK